MSTDTVWTSDDSPYLLTGQILVPPGIRLQIEPGVEIDFNGWFIRIEGLLRAVGTSDQPIAFSGFKETDDGNRVEFGPTAVPWSESNGEGSIIQFAIFTGTPDSDLIPDPPLLVVDGSSPKLSFLEITATDGWGVHLSGLALLEDSRICGNRTGVSVVGSSPTIRRIVICNNREWGVYVTSGASEPVILENVIRGSGSGNYEFASGIRIDGGSPIVRLNKIHGNNPNGVLFVRGISGTTVQFDQNSILGNSVFAVRMEEWDIDVNMANNWWGTNDRDTIDA